MSEPQVSSQSLEAPAAPRGDRWRGARWGLVGIFLVLAAARLAMPWALHTYVNRILNKSQIYQGKIGQVHVHLWRGAYSIDDVRLVKMTGNVPVPLFAARRVELAMQWNAIFHRRLVGQIEIDQPELNFVDADDAAEAQSGAGGPWLEMIRDLFPFKINRAIVKDGSVHFRTFQKSEPVDVYLSHLDATVDNLTNIEDKTAPLATTIEAHALAMDQAKFEYKMKLDPFSYRPTFHIAMRLLGLDVTKTNNLAGAYGGFDFKGGWFDLVMEVDCKEGQLTGYVKPLFRDLQVFDLKKDIQNDDPLQFFWQALLGASAEVLKNQPRNQFGTLVPFHGDDSGSNPDILASLGNVLRNAFVRAYLPRLQEGVSADPGIEFEPPSPTDPLSVGDQP